MRGIFLSLSAVITFGIQAQTYPPQAGEAGSTAVHKDDPSFVAWATGITVTRGYKDISNPSIGHVTAGEPEYALGPPTGEVVSLGDNGFAVLTFNLPIKNGPGFDFAVFENGSAGYLELATVEISSDGIHYFKFSTHSLTQTLTQINSFGTPLAEHLDNIAGKYIGTYGTPFDISKAPNHPLLDKNNIKYVKVIDVVGSIDPQYGTPDNFGNMINDSFPTPFDAGGFDLQAVGVIHQASAAVNDVDKEPVIVYPNPFQDYLYVQNESGISFEITVYDIYGKLRIHQKKVSFEINTSVLPPGVYVLELKNASKKIIRKMIKK